MGVVVMGEGGGVREGGSGRGRRERGRGEEKGFYSNKLQLEFMAVAS